MTILEMLKQSGLLTLLGMGVVFTFIIVLILSMSLLHVVVEYFKGKKQDSSQASVPASSGVVQSVDESEIIAVIAAAVHDKQLNS